MDSVLYNIREKGISVSLLSIYRSIALSVLKLLQNQNTMIFATESKT